jgi:hypothetical protein
MNPTTESPHHAGADIENIVKPIADKTATQSPVKIEARFAAGDGDKKKMTHSSIEQVLARADFKPDEISAIYFGNWLRDYSQLLDPKIVRSTHMPKNFPDVLSREALTKIIDILAVREFTGLMKIDRERFRVTPERLGVYRPSEHIDNPKVNNPSPADPQSRDKDFEPWVLPDDAFLDIDYQTSMKRYIHRSAEVMKAEFQKAAHEGVESTDGLRAFGSALHILEDFFSHSNFVELSLIKQGYSDVLPWTSKADCKHGLPLVTGMFGSTDVIASLAEPLGKILFSIDSATFKPTQPYERSERDQIIQILLSEHPNESFLKAHNEFLNARDKWASLPFSSYIEEVRHYLGVPGMVLNNAMGSVMQGLLTMLGNRVGDAQTHLTENPNTSGSTDPSHSQLAKDHGEHPLHELAALLARTAVLSIGQNMLSQWIGKEGAFNTAEMAASYLTHPMDTEWQDHLVAQWASKNPQLVMKATNESELRNIADHVREEAVQQLETFKELGSRFLETFLSKENHIFKLWKLTPIGWYLTRNR